MAWTYSGNPADSTKDAVRFLVGDTDTTDQLISDGEIAYLATVHGAVNRVASEAARAIAAKFARLMNRSIGGLSADFASKYRQYLELADNILAKDELKPVSLYISGFNRADKDAVEIETDRESTFGRKGQHDNLRYAPASDADWEYRRG